MHSDPQIRTTDDVLAAVRSVSFERSCLDMGWAWEVVSATADAPATGECWLLRCSFRRPDRETGAIGFGFGRWWLIEAGTTVSAVQKTMFAAAKMIVDHELMEAFKVDGKRPFDPHRTVHDLIASGAEDR